MSNEVPVYIIGYGGHAKVIQSIINQSTEFDFSAYIDEEGEVDFIKKHSGKEKDIALALGIGENFTRKKLYDKFLNLGYSLPIIKSSNAIVADDVKIGKGSLVMPGAIINAGAVIGECCVINSGAIIEHDVIINDFSSIAPGGVVSGGCHIGEGVYIGTGAKLIQNLNVGNWSVLGAGAVLINNLDGNKIAVGVPAVTKKTKTPNTLVF